MLSRPAFRRIALVLVVLSVSAGAWSAAPTPGSTAAIDSARLPAKITFNAHIQPILSENCYSCHGPDSSTREAKLRLDRAEFATVPRDDYDPAIVPGQPEKSTVMERILSEDTEEKMPPLSSHKSLKPSEIALLRQWIAEGAVYEEHWSFIAPVRPTVPADGEGWARNPIDRFVAEGLARAQLKPAAAEDPARLLRRVTLDLTGLPPTAAELAAFTRDPSPAAYDRTVDRLLATDASAEHFTRQWLDAVRYGDTHGIHIDNYRSIWPYRDWVIAAYRQNMPFDQFTVEQVAGDMLSAPTLEQKIASGFNRCLPTTSEGGAILPEYEAIYAKDRVETLSTVWLGLTTGCASCHDHKFDPVSTKDFYSLTAFFRNNTMPTMDGNVSDTAPNMLVPAPADRARWPELLKEKAALTTALAQRAKAGDADFQHWMDEGSPLAPLPREPSAIVYEPLAPPQTESPTINGPFGPALKINGVNQVIADPIGLEREGQLSFAAWIRVEGQPTGTLLSSLQSEAGRLQGWELVLEEGKPGFQVHQPNRDDDKPDRAFARTAITPATWHHLLVIYDGSPLRNRAVNLFVDGKEVTAGDPRTFGVQLPSHAPVRLGARTAADLASAHGIEGGQLWLQDLRVYQRSFTTAQVRAEFLELISARDALALNPADRTQAQWKQLQQLYFATRDEPSLKISAQIDRLEAEEAVIRRRGAITLIMEEKKDSVPSAYVLTRGEYANKGEKVYAAVPAALPPLPPGTPANRLSLARWLVDDRNPLTARVTVNRAWQYLFGIGIVESSGDFGVTGARPSNQPLLDWLAVDFRENGWNYRRLIKQMVTSATYRQSAAASPALLERDPENRLWARGPRHRLDAEVLRDQALAASGLLVAKIGGRPVRPYQPEGIWEEVAMKESTTRYYEPDQGENLYRRSLYTLWKRTAPNPAMEILNAPTREVTCVRRDRTNTPLQALVTLNEPVFIESSRQLAAHALHTGPDFDSSLDAISLALVGRTFSSPERAVVHRTFDAALANYTRDPAGAQALLAVGESPNDPTLPAPKLAAWTLVASQVMNLDESLTK